MNKDKKHLNFNKRQISNINSPSSLSKSLEVVNNTNANTYDIIGQPTTTTTLKSSKRLRKLLHEDYCFSCGCGGELIECDACPKVYHAECISTSGIIPPGTWICPWHYCKSCDTTNVSKTKEDGNGIKWNNDIPQALCAHCPLSYCINGCWPLAMSERCFNPSEKVVDELLRRGFYLSHTCLLFVCEKCLSDTQDEGLIDIWNKNKSNLEIKDSKNNIINRNKSVDNDEPMKGSKNTSSVPSNTSIKASNTTTNTATNTTTTTNTSTAATITTAVATTSSTTTTTNINNNTITINNKNNVEKRQDNQSIIEINDNNKNLFFTVKDSKISSNNNTKSITITSFGNNSTNNKSNSNSITGKKDTSHNGRNKFVPDKTIINNLPISSSNSDFIETKNNKPIVSNNNNIFAPSALLFDNITGIDLSQVDMSGSSLSALLARNQSKIVYCLGTNDIDVICYFPTSFEAAKFMQMKDSAFLSIINCCLGNMVWYKGFRWKFLDNDSGKLDNSLNIRYYYNEKDKINITFDSLENYRVKKNLRKTWNESNLEIFTTDTIISCYSIQDQHLLYVFKSLQDIETLLNVPKEIVIKCCQTGTSKFIGTGWRIATNQDILDFELKLPNILSLNDLIDFVNKYSNKVEEQYIMTLPTMANNNNNQINQNSTLNKDNKDDNILISTTSVQYLPINSNHYIDEKASSVLQSHNNMPVNCYYIKDKRKLKMFHSIQEASHTIFYGNPILYKEFIDHSDKGMMDILTNNISKKIIFCCQSSKLTVNFAGFYWLFESDMSNSKSNITSNKEIDEVIINNKLCTSELVDDMKTSESNLNTVSPNEIIDLNQAMPVEKLMTYRIYPGFNERINNLNNDDVYKLLKSITNEINNHIKNSISNKNVSNNISNSSNIPIKQIGELSKNILSHQLVQGLELLPTTTQSLLKWEKDAINIKENLKNSKNSKNKSNYSSQEKQKKKRKSVPDFKEGSENEIEDEVNNDDDDDDVNDDDEDDDDDDDNYSVASEINMEEMKLEGWLFENDSEFENSVYVGQRARKFFPKFGASNGTIMAYLPPTRNEGLELFHFLHEDQDKEDLELHEVLKYVKYYKNNIAVDPEKKSNKKQKIKKSELNVECYTLEGDVLCRFSSASDAEYLLKQKPRANIIVKSCRNVDYIPDCGVKFRYTNSSDNLNNNNNLKTLIKRISSTLIEFKKNKKIAKISNKIENNAKSNSTFLKNNGKFNVRKFPMLGAKYQVNQENIPSLLEEDVINFNRNIVNAEDNDDDGLVWSLKWFDNKYIDDNGIIISNKENNISSENLLELLLFQGKLAQILPGLILRIRHDPNTIISINEDDKDLTIQDNEVIQSLSCISYSTIGCVVDEPIQISSSSSIEEQMIKLQVMGEDNPRYIPISQLKLNFCDEDILYLYKNKNFDFNLTIENLKIIAKNHLELQWNSLIVAEFINLLTTDSLSSNRGNLNHISNEILKFCDVSVISKRDIKLFFYKLRQEDCYSDDDFFEMAMKLELNTKKKRNDFINIYRLSDSISRKVIELKRKLEIQEVDLNEDKLKNLVNNLDTDIDNDIIDLIASDNNEFIIESPPKVDIYETHNTNDKNCFHEKPTPYQIVKSEIIDISNDNSINFLETSSYISNEMKDEQ